VKLLRSFASPRWLFGRDRAASNQRADQPGEQTGSGTLDFPAAGAYFFREYSMVNACCSFPSGWTVYILKVKWSSSFVSVVVLTF
jgi:hypothetical protein